MLLIFDILREAGTRMPVAIGQAVNIVGALVLGQAAVEAKLVSAPVVIITALSGILTLLNINLIGATIVTRFFLLLVTSILGIYGFIFGFLLIILHLTSLRSFGVPYMLGITSVKNHNGQDVWIRAPWWSMTLRPKIIAARNLVRQVPGRNRGKQGR
jgi:spore germination protein KA